MTPESIEDMIKMALYHPENHIRCKVKRFLEDSTYGVRSCFEKKDGVYVSLEDRDGKQAYIRVCDIPVEYFGVEHPESHPFIVTIAE
jgi:hypothetical protein